MRPFPGDHATTDVEPRLELNLVALRAHPHLEWSDANGTHAIPIEGRMLVGASPHVGVFVADRMVSRLHAEIELRDDGVWIRDLGSRNGTWVEGVFVQSARVPLGGHVKVGGTMLGVTPAGDASSVPLWPHERFGPLWGRSEVMRELFLRLSQYANTESPILIQGETGTGKELVAQAIHEASSRANGPFVVVDCAALPETLLESELFGHAKGAFTGASGARIGAFEAAHGGTAFIDEIGELPLAMQPKLLRMLESQQLRRIGETAHRRIDVRFVCATHRDLQSMVGAGAFREDLFFRIAVLPVHIPPLRARSEDIPVLLSHFLEKRPGLRVDVGELMRHAWPGNVRELRSFAERAIAVGPEVAWALTRGAELRDPPQSAAVASPPMDDRAWLERSAPIPTNRPFKELREQWVDHFERAYIEGLVRTHGRDTGAIADAAELDRSYVQRLLRKHSL